ncbi:MAG TPA: hypothetical protein VK918_07535, partial [Pyrinomonadaceae bacterium]|nr:hypothetical protein [Pyrinomonadaceae bacterium]
MILFCLTKIFYVAILLCLGTVAVFSQDTAPPDKIVLNKRPLVDFSNLLREKLRLGDVDWNGHFSVQMKGVLDEKGRIDPSTVQIVSTGDPELAAIAVDGIEAVDASELFALLKDLGMRPFTLHLSQDADDFTARISTEAETEARARLIEPMFRFVIDESKKRLGDSHSPNAKYDLIILNATSISRRENVLEFQVFMPK